MKPAEWFFDFVSPFAYLQSRMLERFAGKLEIAYTPVLFAGLLNHWGSTGPAELAPKRLWTYRMGKWLGDRHGIPFRMPPAHPFNPIKPLRLAIALDNDAAAVQAIFDFIWAEGRDAADPAEWAALTGRLGAADADARIAEPAVKAALRANTERAIETGVFGVPTLAVDGELFWGLDGTDMVLDYLADPDMFTRGEMARHRDLPTGAVRRQ